MLQLSSAITHWVEMFNKYSDVSKFKLLFVIENRFVVLNNHFFGNQEHAQDRLGMSLTKALPGVGPSVTVTET